MKALVWILLCVLPLNLIGEEVHTIEAIWNQGHYIEFEDGSVWYIDWWIIAEILENGELIKLENGFCWNLVAPFSGFGGFFGDVSKEEYLQHIQEKWSIGDEVALGVWREKEAGFVSYMLRNMRAGSVPVRFELVQGLIPLHKKTINS